MMQLAPGTQVWLSCRPTDMRKGFDGLSAEVKNVLLTDPFSGHLFVFRGQRGDRQSRREPAHPPRRDHRASSAGRGAEA